MNTLAEKLAEAVESVLEKAAQKTVEDLFARLEPFTLRLSRIERLLEEQQPWSRAYR